MLTIQEFAKEFKVHPNTVRNLIKSGRLKFIKIGSDYRITPEQVNEFVTTSQVSVSATRNNG
jgi:excisionase family DNA binding protein